VAWTFTVLISLFLVNIVTTINFNFLKQYL
jgi:hypothetical protein